MGNQEAAILGLKQELKRLRARSRDLAAQNSRWRGVATTLRKMAALDEDKFQNLLRAETLPLE